MLNNLIFKPIRLQSDIPESSSSLVPDYEIFYVNNDAVLFDKRRCVAFIKLCTFLVILYFRFLQNHDLFYDGDITISIS